MLLWNYILVISSGGGRKRKWQHLPSSLHPMQILPSALGESGEGRKKRRLFFPPTVAVVVAVVAAVIVATIKAMREKIGYAIPRRR
mmetsp:Transcript_22512/g.36267  ORF Transcript_22512/g.36267 Transcript_22512/m.36267 type:complete len:86 (+) Transcript_22512:69-326(+)